MQKRPGSPGWRILTGLGTTAFAGALALSGCVTYGPQQLSAMSSYQLCELDAVQRVNLAPATREQLAAELARRNEDCRAHLPKIQQALAHDLYERTYFNQSP
jgi:hypothetical protein